MPRSHLLSDFDALEMGLSSDRSNVSNTKELTPIIFLETLVVETLVHQVEAESLEVVETLELPEKLAILNHFRAWAE